MYHFLAQLGKSKAGEFAMPTLTMVGLTGISVYHCYGHDFAEKFFGASHPNGSPIKICDHLRNIITEVYDEVSKASFRDGVKKSTEKLKNLTVPEAPIRWFAAATIDPFIVGSVNLSNGASIAVPSAYNYQRPEDLPDSLFEVKKVALFRTNALTDQQKEEKKLEELNKDALVVRNQDKVAAETVLKIDRESEMGQEYANSLLLSDDAKRYCLAKQLYISDTYKPVYKMFLFFSSMMVISSAARTHVKLMKLKNAHVSQRMPGYGLSAILGVGMYYFLSISIDNYAEETSHNKAIELGERYMAGAREYWKKRETRDEILGIEPSFLRYVPTFDN